RYLATEPVQAFPPSARYRFGKFIKRNQSIVIPTAILTLLTVVGLSTGMAVVTRERDEARAQRQRADARFRVAFQTLYRLRLTTVNLRLAAGPERSAKMRRTLEEECIRYHRQLLEGSEDDPGIAFEIAQSHFYLALLMRGSSDYVDGAERHLRQAVTL